MRTAFFVSCFASFFALVGCDGGLDAPDAGGGDAALADAGGADGAVAVDAGSDPDGGPDSDAGGPWVHVHLRSSQAAVAHAPSTSGQTPGEWWSGVRSLELLRSDTDPAPLLVFSHGDGSVEASYADGADTVVGSARIADLVPGTYTRARVVHTHVRFTIDATLHAGFGPMPGLLDELIVLSDRTTIEGATRMQGDWRTVFRTGGMTFPAEGSGLSLAAVPGGGFDVSVVDGETVYSFPVLLEVRNDLLTDLNLIFEVNVHEGFRWTDVTATEYVDGVFDFTPGGTEPVVQAGANSYAYFLE